jgi:hypothetical protein
MPALATYDLLSHHGPPPLPSSNACLGIFHFEEICLVLVSLFPNLSDGAGRIFFVECRILHYCGSIFWARKPLGYELDTLDKSVDGKKSFSRISISTSWTMVHPMEVH